MPRVFTLNYRQHIRSLLGLLNSSFSEQQESSLQDYVETSIMLQYNTELYLHVVSH